MRLDNKDSRKFHEIQYLLALGFGETYDRQYFDSV